MHECELCGMKAQFVVNSGFGFHCDDEHYHACAWRTYTLERWSVRLATCGPVNVDADGREVVP